MFFPTGYECKANLRNTKYNIFLELFCGNSDNIKAFKKQCDKYDMLDMLIFSALIKLVLLVFIMGRT